MTGNIPGIAVHSKVLSIKQFKISMQRAKMKVMIADW
jgi:hypothetical protein